MAKADQEVYRPADACRIAEVAPYVLRYWETEFPALSEGKDKAGSKYYTARDVRIISRIRELLYDEGFTVAGAKKRLEAEIAEGRFDEGLSAAPPLRDQKDQRDSRAKTPMPQSRATDQPSFPKLGGGASAPAASAVAPAKSAAAPPPVGSALDFDRKSVVRELRAIVKLLGTSTKD
ncbi:MAG TPA: MerR family transcriptional regulator [Thermoanaerobaculia bacterium]